MATWPAKNTYLAGAVYTATQANEIGNALNTLPFQAGKNRVLNSNFSVWQRGTSISVPTNSYGYYTSDRWNLTTGSATPNAHTVSRQATSDTTNLPNIQNCARVQRNNGQTSTYGAIFIQCFESVNSIPLANKQVILSFYARKGADYSPSASALTATIWQGTGTDQNPYTSGYTGQSTTGAIVTLTTTWQRFTLVASIASTTTEISVGFVSAPTGTAGTNDYYEVTGVQLEAYADTGYNVTPTASPYAPNSATYQGELAACQRYYYQITGQYGYIVTGTAANTTDAIFALNCPVAFRTSPSISVSSVSDFYLIPGNKTFTSLTASTSFGNIVSFYTSGSTGLLANQSWTIFPTLATSSIKLSAEL